MLTVQVPAGAASVETAARIVRDADLGLFGIDSNGQPTPTRYPKAFSKGAHKVWLSVLDSPAYQKDVRAGKPASVLWQVAVRLFLKACAADGVYAFEGRPDHEATAMAFLKSTRSKVVRYFDDAGFFDHLKIRSVKRDYSFTANNFSISCEAALRPVTDATFERWLEGLPSPNLRKHEDGVYRKSVYAHVDVWYRVTRGTSYLGYRIFCHTPVRLLNDLPSKAKMSDYVERKLWLPAVRENRIAKLGNKNF